MSQEPRDDAADVAARVIERAVGLGLTIATCESLTGGGVGALLTSVPGASGAYVGGFITYATEQKIKMVGVDAEFIAHHGVINDETAKQMAAGALRRTRTNLAVSTTGVAGPTGQDGHAPGEVWIGVAWRRGSEVTAVAFEHQFSGTRADVRAAATQAAVSALLDHLLLS